MIKIIKYVMIKKYGSLFFDQTYKTQEKGPRDCEAPLSLGICLCLLLSSDYASHLTNLV